MWAWPWSLPGRAGGGAGRLGGRGRRCRLGLRLRFLGFGGLRPGALHIDAAPEVGAFGDCDARRCDVAIDRTVVTDVDLLSGRDVARDLAEDDHGLGEHLRL